MKVAVRDVLDAELPEVYGRELFVQKVDAIFDHIYVSYFDDGGRVHDAPDASADPRAAVATTPTIVEDVTDDLLAQIRSDPDRQARLLEEILGTTATWTCPTAPTTTFWRRGGAQSFFSPRSSMTSE